MPNPVGDSNPCFDPLLDKPQAVTPKLTCPLPTLALNPLKLPHSRSHECRWDWIEPGTHTTPTGSRRRRPLPAIADGHYGADTLSIASVTNT